MDNTNDTEYQMFFELNGSWPELKAKLAGPDADRVGDCLQSYINAYYEKINAEAAFEKLNADWGEACVHTDRYGWLNDEMRRTLIHSAALFDELQALVAE